MNRTLNAGFYSVAYKSAIPAATAVMGGEIQIAVLAEFSDPVGGSPEQFAAFLRADGENNARTLKITGVRLD